MSGTARKLRSFEDLYREIEVLPQGTTGEILAPGELRAMGRPGRAHRVVSRRALAALRRFDREEDGVGWCFEVEAEIRFGVRLFVPDLAGWRVAEGEPYPPAYLEENPVAVAPDWTCEILSRGTQRGDRAVKLPVYAAAGVGHVWIVDPEARTVEVYETRSGQPALVATARAGADEADLPPFGPIRIGAWWQPGEP